MKNKLFKKRFLGFRTRIAVSFKILFKPKKAHICIMTCPKCGSANIKPLLELDEDSNTNARLKQKVEADEKLDFAYTGIAYCLSCGSICGSCEYWFYRNGDKK